MTKHFTGRHMLAVMLGFFGTVIAVNVTMAWFASNTFGGTVVDNSYVASQKFNGWLAAGRAQEALGWSVTVNLDESRHVRASTGLGAATLSGIATHPLGRLPEQRLRFVHTGEGHYRSVAPLPDGRFLVRIKVSAGGREADFKTDIPA